MSKIYKAIYWLSLTIIISGILSLIIYQYSNLEFANETIRHSFFNIVFWGIPLAILLTLFGTINKANKKSKNIFISSLTILGACLVLFLIALIGPFIFPYLIVINEKLLFVHKSNNEVSIKEQTYTYGV